MNPHQQVEQAERAVVGECIFSPASARTAAGIVTPADFHDMRLGATFGLIAAMVSRGGPEAVTPLTVAAEINRRRADEKGKGRTQWPDAGDIPALAVHGIPGAIDEHARLIREAAVSRALAAFGRKVTQAAESGEDPSTLAPKVVEDAKAIRDGARTDGLALRLLSDLFAAEDPGFEWLIPGLLEKRDRLIVTGGEGLGKSTFGRQVIQAAAAGVHPFKPLRFAPLTALVVDCENSERQWRRKAHVINLAVEKLAGIDPADNIHIACSRRMDITSAADLGAIHSAIDDVQPDIVMIGPLYRLIPRAINSDDDAAPLLAALDSIRDRGPALIMEAHAGHAIGKGGERDYRPRGSSALLGWPEFGFGLAPDANDPARVQVIRWRGDRDEREWPLAMRRGGLLPWTNDAIEPGREYQRPHAGEFSADAIQNRHSAA